MAITNVPAAVGPTPRRPLPPGHPAARHGGGRPRGGACYLWGTDPHTSGNLLPRCPFNWATGLLCPACGGTRMVYDLMHGDVAAALHDNAALLTVGLPVAVCLSGRWLSEGLRGRRWAPRMSTRGKVAVLSAAVAWTVARNLL